MDVLQSMRTFVRVVEAGGFTAAATAANTNTAAVSRAVAELEARLQTKLLNRTTRRIALTAAGDRYLARCYQALALIDEAEAEAANARAKPSGRLKLHCVAGFGQRYIVGAIAAYRQRYPDVRIELHLSQRVPNLLEEGYDLSIALARELPDSGNISQVLGTAFSVLCASPDYVARRGVPDTLEALRGFDCLQMVTTLFPSTQWVFDGPGGAIHIDIDAPFMVNTGEAMAEAIKYGMGIGALPGYSALDGLRNGALVRVLPSYTLQQMQAYAIYPSRQYLDAKIKTWVDHLKAYLPAVMEEEKQAIHTLAQAQTRARGQTRTKSQTQDGGRLAAVESRVQRVVR
jgi:DNA-binding transcriptional LysR family regulator